MSRVSVCVCVCQTPSTGLRHPSFNKVPESDARIGVCECVCQTPSTGLRHPTFNHCRICSYAIGSRKLSANEQFFVGAQTVCYKQLKVYQTFVL